MRHFDKRLKERFNLKLKSKHRKQLINEAESGKYKSTAANGNRRIYYIYFKGNMLRIVYDVKDKALVTVLHVKTKFQVAKSNSTHRKKYGKYKRNKHQDYN